MTSTMMDEEENPPKPNWRKTTPEYVSLKTAIRLTPVIILREEPTTLGNGTPKRNRRRFVCPIYGCVDAPNFMYSSARSN